jgi:hypothetical protein
MCGSFFFALRLSRRNQSQPRKVAAEIAAIDGSQTVTLVKRVCADEEVWNQVPARTTFLPVFLEDLPGFERGTGVYGIEPDAQPLQSFERLLG